MSFEWAPEIFAVAWTVIFALLMFWIGTMIADERDGQ